MRCASAAARCVRSLPRASSLPAATGAAAARFSTQWLQGKPPTIDRDAGTLAALYYKSVRDAESPYRTAIVSKQLDDALSLQLFDGFIDALGMRPGDSMALWLGDEPENLVLQYAAALTGVRIVSLDPALSFDAVTAVLSSESVRVLALSPRHGAHTRTQELTRVFEPELAPFQYSWGYEPLTSKRFRSLKYIVQTGFDAIPGVMRLQDVPVYGEAGSYDWDEIAALQASIPASSPLAVRFSASPSASPASSAAARDAEETHAQTVAIANRSREALALKSTDTVVVTAPLYTTFGFAAGALACTAAGCKTVLPSKTFDAEATLASITREKAQVIVATQQQIEALSAALTADAAKPADKRAGYSVASLRAAMIHGAKAGSVALGSASLPVVAAPALK